MDRVYKVDNLIKYYIKNGTDIKEAYRKLALATDKYVDYLYNKVIG